MPVPARFHSRDLRKGRFSLAGQVYLVTFTCQDRKPLFADFSLACMAARALSEANLWRDGRLLAWVLMPDHWHGLIELGGKHALSTVVGRAKAVSARVINGSHAEASPVWQRGFHDRALRHDDCVIAAARYVIGNPVRAGLAGDIGGYSFWDAVWVGEGFDLG